MLISGIYDAIEKLGSLVARVVLAPLEESAYVYFTQHIDRDGHVPKGMSGAIDTLLHAEYYADNTVMNNVTQVLHGIVRCTAILGAIVCTFGFAYARTALTIYGGTTLATRTGA